VPAVNHRDAVRDLEGFIEILRDHEHRRAARGDVDQGLADQRGGARIDAPGRLVDDEQLRLAFDLAPDDVFLQVAAGKLGRARVVPGPRTSKRG
jgi:hypothetical protein